MTRIKFTIPVHPVTKKNSQQIITNPKTGRPFLIPSKQFREFEKECAPYFREVKKQTGPVNFPINSECVFYVSKHLKYDLTNLLEAVDDAMVTSGLLIDDNRDIIAAHDGSRVYFDKQNPRIEIELTELKDYAQWNNTKDEQARLF